MGFAGIRNWESRRNLKGLGFLCLAAQLLKIEEFGGVCVPPFRLSGLTRALSVSER